MKFNPPALVLLAIVSFTATGIYTSFQQSKEAASVMSSAVADHSGSKNPYESAIVLDGLYQATFMSGCKSAPFFPCLDDEKKASETLRGTSRTLMLTAVEQGDARAINAVIRSQRPRGYSRDHTFNNWWDIRDKAKPMIVKLAGNPGAAKETLLYAGQILLAGDQVTQDYRQAHSFLSKAWEMGENEAATGVKMVFEALNDAQNTYLWNLRCTRMCTRIDPKLYARLSASEILELQELAKDRTVVVYGDSPLNAKKG